MMSFRTPYTYDYTEEHYSVNLLPSCTEQDMSLSIKDMFNRLAIEEQRRVLLANPDWNGSETDDIDDYLPTDELSLDLAEAEQQLRDSYARMPRKQVDDEPSSPGVSGSTAQRSVAVGSVTPGDDATSPEGASGPTAQQSNGAASNGAAVQ
jgi:hypothetical protein